MKSSQLLSILLIAFTLGAVVTEGGFTKIVSADENQIPLFMSKERIAEQNELKNLEPFINSEFLNKTTVNISNVSNSSVRRTPGDDIKIIRTDVKDNRDFEGSTNWAIKCLLENTGNRPAYIHTKLVAPANYNEFYFPEDYTLMDIGDRIQLDDWSGTAMKEYIAVIDYCPTERPVISPEFSSLNEIHLRRGYMWTKEPSPFVDVKSITYNETNAEKKWGSMVIECKGTENQKGNIVKFSANNAVYTGIPVTLEGDKYISVEIPLRGENPANKTTKINIYSFTLSESETARQNNNSNNNDNN